MKKSVSAAISFVAAVLVIGIIVIAVALNGGDSSVPAGVQQYTYEVVNTYPHDTEAFTEGLFYDDGFLYESTGLQGSSTLRRVNLTSGIVGEEYELAWQYFGEGATAVGDRIVQLTWQSQIGFVYDKNSFAIVENFTYPGEGWGITFDGTRLIMSNGSDHLLFLEPNTFEQIGHVQVCNGNIPVPQLNELEYVNGYVYANVFQQRNIAIINPETGQVKGWIDLSSLQGTTDSNPENVLNGIAYDAEGNRLFVTGKNWAFLYEIRLFPLD